LPRLRRSGHGISEAPDGAQHASRDLTPVPIHRVSQVLTRRGPIGPRFGIAFGPWPGRMVRGLGLGGVVCGTVALAAIAVAPGSARAADLPSELTTVAQVKFEGRHSVREKELRAAIKTRTSSRLLFRERPLLRIDFLRADTMAIENVYHQHGYLDARATYKVNPAKESGRVIVTFVIEEGRRSRISRVDLEGVTVMPADPIRRKLFARPGKPFNPYFLPADTLKIAEAYRDRGYFPLIVPSSQRESTGVAVRYSVTEGARFHFGEVRITNMDQLSVSEHFVRRELLIRPGSVYRSTRVQESVERLYETGVFSQVQLSPLIDSTATTVEFDLALRQRKPRWIDAGIGSGTSERLLTTAEWGHRNLLRRGMQGELEGRLALDDQARFLLSRIEASLLEPWLFASRTRGKLTIYHETRHERDQFRLTAHEAEGVSFQLQRRLGRYARLSLLQDNTFAREEIVRDTAVIESPRTRYTTHRLQLSADRDTRDYPIQVTRGSYQTVSSEIAGGPLQGTSSFTKHQFSSSWYTPLSPTLQIATRLRGGLITPYGNVVQFSQEMGIDPEVARVPSLDRFEIGGVNSVRGYAEGELPANGFGGLVLMQANVELRAQLYGPFGVEVFIDGGNVWARRDRVKHGRFAPEVSSRRMTPDDVRWVLGFGPRLQLPFGPLRLDYTWWARPDENGKRQRGIYQFAIGSSF